MRRWPRSLAGRMLSVSMLTTVLALALAAIGIGHVLERFVIQGLDQQLDAQGAMLARAVHPDGTFDPTRLVNLPAFETGEPGWGWRVDSPRGRWMAGDPTDGSPDPGEPGSDHGPARRTDGRHDHRPGDGVARSGETVHWRQLGIVTTTGPARVTVNGPRRVVLRPLREAMQPLLVSLALLGAALALATAVQLRVALRPLRALRAALAEVRSGRRRLVPSEQPTELAPLAAELNALIEQNAAQLAHARRHVANLAHGLKTPLAAMGVELAEDGRDPDGSLRALAAKIDRQIRHHLGRARAAAPGNVLLARTPLAPAVADLTAALARIHADRSVGAEVAVATDLAVAIDAQDLDEMLGNLLDNAWRHARARVTVEARRRDAMIELVIGDDGPGLDEAALREALVPGRRLDEQGDGHGFGLPIAQELAELHGGRLVLGRSAAGGLDATLVLPIARPA